MVTQHDKSVHSVGDVYGGIMRDYRGKSTDSKPILAAENNGSTYYEMDTGRTYMYDGATGEWVLQSSANGGSGMDGIDGKSAYEIAVENGFIGTEQEWLASLRGADGKDGGRGVDGKDGADGFSPVISVAADTDTEYILSIQQQSGTLTTPNLKGSGGSSGGDAASVRVSALNGMITDFLGENPARIREITMSEMVNYLAVPPTTAGSYYAEEELGGYIYKTAMRVTREAPITYAEVLSVKVPYNMSTSASQAVTAVAGGGFIRTAGAFSSNDGTWQFKRVVDSSYVAGFSGSPGGGSYNPSLPVTIEGNRVTGGDSLQGDLLVTRNSLWDGIMLVKNSTMWAAGGATSDGGGNSGGSSGDSAANIEYIYNYNAGDYSDSSSFATGKDGVLFPSSSDFSNIAKQVQASRDLTGAKCAIECSLGYDVWQDVTAVGYGFVRAGADKNGFPSNTSYGVSLEFYYGSYLNVQFHSGGAYPSNGMGADGCEWSSLNAQGYKWRVRVEYPS